jgi:hypothetical protein
MESRHQTKKASSLSPSTEPPPQNAAPIARQRHEASAIRRALLALLPFLIVGSVLGQLPATTKIRITTWNLEWFPNGSPHEAAPEKQAQRIKAAADVLRKLDPDILLLQEMRDYEVRWTRLRNRNYCRMLRQNWRVIS